LEEGGAPDGVFALLGRQEASGLWDEPGAAPAEQRQVRATALALLELLREGVTTTHALHGAQVKKAVEALVQAAARLAAAQPQLVEFALGVAWLCASGGRTRGNIEKVVSTSGFDALAPLLGNEPATRQRVDQLAGAI
jgi:Ca-activated chloride channel homolog